MNDWNGRHILIVGASEGIGRETAMLCARRGARLSLVARHDSVKKVAAGLDKKGHQGFCFDVAAIEKIEDFIKNVVEIQGPLDGMVYCVGPQCVRPLRMLNPGIVNEIITNGFGGLYRAGKVSNKKEPFQSTNEYCFYIFNCIQGRQSGKDGLQCHESGGGCSKPKPCSGTGTKRNPVEFGLPGGCEYQEAGKPAGDGWK